jgi:hypothetical protein
MFLLSESKRQVQHFVMIKAFESPDITVIKTANPLISFRSPMIRATGLQIAAENQPPDLLGNENESAQTSQRCEPRSTKEPAPVPMGDRDILVNL